MMQFNIVAQSIADSWMKGTVACRPHSFVAFPPLRLKHLFLIPSAFIRLRSACKVRYPTVDPLMPVLSDPVLDIPDYNRCGQQGTVQA